MEMKVYTSMSDRETSRLGIELGTHLHRGDTVAMYGDLGSGKTEFVKGICLGLHVDDLVSSPTFTIVNEYSGNFGDGTPVRIYHIDLYRIESTRELEEIGLLETLADPEAIKLIEWSEHASGALPHEGFEVRLSQILGEENWRKIEVVQMDVASIGR